MCAICMKDVCPSGCPNAENETVTTCTACGGGIKAGQRYYRSRLLGIRLCEDCYYEIEEEEAE